MEDHHEETSFVCELLGQDAENIGPRFVEIPGVTPELAKEYGIESGKTTFFAPDAIIRGDRLELPQSANSNLTSQDSDAFILGTLDSRSGASRNRKLATATVNKRVLVVRVIAPDSSTSSSTATISDSIFGTSGDTVNLKSQYEACSFGKLVFEPAPNQTLPNQTLPAIVNGVVEVTIPRNISGASSNAITNAVYKEATTLLGNLRFQFDHVMFCLPPGTSGNWIGTYCMGDSFPVATSDLSQFFELTRINFSSINASQPLHTSITFSLFTMTFGAIIPVARCMSLGTISILDTPQNQGMSTVIRGKKGGGRHRHEHFYFGHC